MKTLTPERPGRPTGPRTPTGKAISSRNAWRHGLTLPIRADPLWRPTVIKLERAIAGEQAPREVARLLAEGAVELSRIAHARAAHRGHCAGAAPFRKTNLTWGAGTVAAELHFAKRNQRRARASWRRGTVSQNELHLGAGTVAAELHFAKRNRRRARAS